MDKMLGRYTTKRSTQMWPLAFFYNILDIACLAAYLYYENNKMLVKKSYERRLFYYVFNPKTAETDESSLCLGEKI